MSPATACAALLLALPLTLAPPDELIAKAAVDDVRTRRFSITTELTLDEMKVSIDGQELDPAMMGAVEMTDRTGFELEVEDRVLEVEEGRPTRFVRKYVSAERTAVHDAKAPAGEDQSGELRGSTSLEGRAVEFTRTDEGFRARFADGDASEGEGPDAALEGLRAELDLAEWLPAGELAVDDTWEIDPERILTLLDPAGALPMEDEWEGAAEILSRRTRANAALRGYEGTFEARYKGTSEREGRVLALVELTCELGCQVDLTEMMREEEPEVSGPEGVEIEVDIRSAELEHALEGGGTLSWDLERGALHALELALDTQRVSTTGMELRVGERRISQRQTQIQTGTTRIALEFE